MKRFWTAATTVALLGTSGAYAADMLVSKALPPSAAMAPPYNWSGVYLGGYAGGSFGGVTATDGAGNVSDTHFSPGGVTAGGYMGANHQINAAVLGVELEYGYDGQGSGDHANSGVTNGNAWTTNSTLNGTGVGRLRARVGYSPMANWLIYGAGGWTFLSSSGSMSGTWKGTPFTGSGYGQFNGWNLGLGAEYAFNDHWIGRVEYIHDGFQSKTITYSGAVTGTGNLHFGENTARLGVAYKF